MKPIPRKEFDKRFKEEFERVHGKKLREGIEIIDGKPEEVWYGFTLKKREEKAGKEER